MQGQICCEKKERINDLAEGKKHAILQREFKFRGQPSLLPSPPPGQISPLSVKKCTAHFIYTYVCTDGQIAALRPGGGGGEEAMTDILNWEGLLLHLLKRYKHSLTNYRVLIEG